MLNSQRICQLGLASLLFVSASIYASPFQGYISNASLVEKGVFKAEPLPLGMSEEAVVLNPGEFKAFSLDLTDGRDFVLRYVVKDEADNLVGACQFVIGPNPMTRYFRASSTGEAQCAVNGNILEMRVNAFSFGLPELPGR